ncbi:HipA family kinase [Bacillus subtilis]|uniref:HipA family kinase n=1 Tax=Bacillus subtilis TaxID=1423 RepID=UPI00106290CC|nr:HipA family kinase [Bacillus subtilis]
MPNINERLIFDSKKSRIVNHLLQISNSMIIFNRKENTDGILIILVVSHFNIPTYNVVSLEKQIPNGITQPLLMKTDDGLYVVKHCQNVDGTKILVNEFVCYKLAKLLSVPIPKASLIKISEEIINADPNLQKTGIKPGIHFGSQFNKNANSSAVAPPLLNRIINQDDIPSIILFDQIIYNDDRTKNKGNLLIDTKAKEILAIDHSHTFKNGALWNETELRRINSDPLCLVKDFHEYNYRVMLNYVNGHSPFNKILSKIHSLKQEDIDWCFEELPLEWNLIETEKVALKRFIWYRICNVNDFLELLKDQCPGWKGGNRGA